MIASTASSTASSSTAASTAAARTSNNGAMVAEGGHDYWVSRVTRFYQHYNPDKVSEVQEALRKYKHREPLLMQHLVQKYGPEPTGTTTIIIIIDCYLLSIIIHLLLSIIIIYY